MKRLTIDERRILRSFGDSGAPKDFREVTSEVATSSATPSLASLVAGGYVSRRGDTYTLTATGLEMLHALAVSRID